MLPLLIALRETGLPARAARVSTFASMGGLPPPLSPDMRCSSSAHIRCFTDRFLLSSYGLAAYYKTVNGPLANQYKSSVIY